MSRYEYNPNQLELFDSRPFRRFPLFLNPNGIDMVIQNIVKRTSDVQVIIQELENKEGEIDSTQKRA